MPDNDIDDVACSTQDGEDCQALRDLFAPQLFPENGGGYLSRAQDLGLGHCSVNTVHLLTPAAA